MLTKTEPIVTAKKLLAYEKENAHRISFESLETVIVFYQKTALKYFLSKHPEMRLLDSAIYALGNVGILAGFGVGAPSIAIKLEELMELGTRRIIAVGTAGTLSNHQIGDFILCPKALAEDGVAHHYLGEGEVFAPADPGLIEEWVEFARKKALPEFYAVNSWSFSAIFRESPAHIERVKALGCGVVEMEAATLSAMGKEKGVQTLSLFVISDAIDEDGWTPHFKEPIVQQNLERLADWALEFCRG